MGEVYLAEDSRLDRRVALKILPAEFASDAGRMARFVQEAKSASALNHPNIITIYEIGEADGIQFIASEFIEGETLRSHLLRGRLSLREILEVAVQIAGALSAAHGAGIIHRDIKPENMMLRPDGYLKILDFGLAKPSEPQTPATSTQAPTIAKASTEPGMLLGTLAYMSPEQARGRAIDARTDIFSFGVLLYEMVTGRSPFEGDTTSDIIASILMTEPPPLMFHSPGTPPELERIVTKTLAKKLEERYQTAQDLSIDLKRLKQQLEIDGELERSRSGDSIRSPLAMNSGQIAGAVAPRATQPVHTTSSAEYIAGEIGKHKKGFVLAAVSIVVIALAAVVYFAFGTGGNKIDSLAVLPFVNQSDDNAADYLADGISESVIYDLSHLTALRVIPRSSVLRYAGRQIDPQQAARELGVRAIFTGTIKVKGDELAISAELIDVKENRLLWGQKYNHKVRDSLAVQQEISKNISDRLRLNPSGAEEGLLTRRHTNSGEAYQEYLKGQFWLNKRNEEGFRKAIEFYNQAIEKDPSYALAYTGLADSYSLLGTYALLEPQQGFPKAKAAAMKALELDPDLAEAHTSLANMLSSYYWDFANAESEFKRALELNSKYATAHHWYAEYLQLMGRYDQALAEIKRAQELDSGSLIISAVEGRIRYCNRQYDPAVDKLKATLQMDQRFGPAYAFLSEAYLMKGMNELAVKTAQDPVGFAPGV